MQRSIQNLATLALGIAATMLASAAAAQTFAPTQPLGSYGMKRSQFPLATGGYCVVTLKNSRTWTLGDTRVGGEFDGRQYYFATHRERDIFAASPETYAPALRGDCIVAFAASGERVAGRPELAMTYDGRVYFFVDEQSLRTFQGDPGRFVSADLIDGGRCPVCRIDQSRSVPGMPQTLAVRRGLRFQFANAHCRRLFIEAPLRYDQPDDVVPVEVKPTRRRTDDVAAKPLKSGDHDDPLGAVPAMSGYCPVSIAENGTWVRGRYDFRVEVGDWMFLAAGPEQREKLDADPAKYVPAFGGDCIVTHVEQNQRVRGSVFHVFEYDRRLFLFADAQQKELFKQDPTKYALADVAAGGHCVVSQVDEGRTTAGLAEYATWHAGLLYRFAGAEQKRKFLVEPHRYAPIESGGESTLP
jgi:YHS domain-containing protein